MKSQIGVMAKKSKKGGNGGVKGRLRVGEELG